MLTGFALLAPSATTTSSRPASLPPLAGAAYRGHFDFTDAGKVARGSSDNLVSEVANSLAGGSALGPLTLPDAAYKPRFVPATASTLSGIDFTADRANFLRVTGALTVSGGSSVTVLAVWRRRGFPPVPNPFNGETGLLAGIAGITITENADTADIVRGPFDADKTTTLHTTDGDGASSPYSDFAVQRWCGGSFTPTAAMGEQGAQTVRSWHGEAGEPVDTTPVEGLIVSGTTSLRVGTTATDTSGGAVARSLLHEVVLIEGPVTDAEIAALRAWAAGRIADQSSGGGSNGGGGTGGGGETGSAVQLSNTNLTYPLAAYSNVGALSVTGADPATTFFLGANPSGFFAIQDNALSVNREITSADAGQHAVQVYAVLQSGAVIDNSFSIGVSDSGTGGGDTGGSGGTGSEQPPVANAPIQRLDILCRGQSNAYFANSSGAFGLLRDIVAYLTRIPDVRLIARQEDHATQDNTIHSSTFSYYPSPNGGEGRWLDGVNGQQPAQWQNAGPLAQAIRAAERFVSADPNHAVLDYRLHCEFDANLYDHGSPADPPVGPWQALYRDGAWEVTRRLRQAFDKPANRVLTAYAACSYQGKGFNNSAMFPAWLADVADASRNVVLAAGNQLDGSPGVRYGPGSDDYSHGDDAGLRRQTVRAAVNLSRVIWQRGWCPPEVDLSWLPGLGPRIASAARSGGQVTLTVAHDRGTALVGPGNWWQAFSIDGLGSATAGVVNSATQVTLTFGATVPANAVLRHCRDLGFYGAGVLRDNWATVAPPEWQNVPGRTEHANLLQKTLTPVVVP